MQCRDIWCPFAPVIIFINAVEKAAANLNIKRLDYEKNGEVCIY